MTLKIFCVRFMTKCWKIYWLFFRINLCIFLLILSLLKMYGRAWNTLNLIEKFNDKLYFSRLNVRRVKIRKVWIWMLLATEFYFYLILETTFQDHSNIQTDLIQWTQKWLPDVPNAKNLILTKKVAQIILISFSLEHI